MKRFGLILVAMLGLAAPASADVVYTLNCNTLACPGVGDGNWGTVTLSTPSVGNVHVVVALASGFTFSDKNNDVSLLYNGGDSDTMIMSGFNAGFGPTASGANGTRTASPFTPGSPCQCFDFGVQKTNASTQPTSMVFDVTKTGGLTLGNFVTNDGGIFYFAAQIRTTASNTLFWVASKGPGVQVPEPATWLLFFAALAGLTVLYRRRRLARA